MVDFTKIHWAGDYCILITDRNRSRYPILILTKDEIEDLIEEWKKKH